MRDAAKSWCYHWIFIRRNRWRTYGIHIRVENVLQAQFVLRRRSWPSSQEFPMPSKSLQLFWRHSKRSTSSKIRGFTSLSDIVECKLLGKKRLRYLQQTSRRGVLGFAPTSFGLFYVCNKLHFSIHSNACTISSSWKFYRWPHAICNEI